MSRRPIEVIVSYSGDAADWVTISLKLMTDNVAGFSTVPLVGHEKSHPHYECAVTLLEDLVETMALTFPVEDDNIIFEVWEAILDATAPR